MDNTRHQVSIVFLNDCYQQHNSYMHYVCIAYIFHIMISGLGNPLLSTSEYTTSSSSTHNGMADVQDRSGVGPLVLGYCDSANTRCLAL